MDVEFRFTFDWRTWLFGFQWNGPGGCYEAARLVIGPLMFEWSW